MSHDYAHEHATRFKQQLIELLRIPSISTLTAHADDVRRAAQWIVDDLQQMGFTLAQTFEQDGFLPLVYGEWLGAGDSAPTVLVYCHYDVQPAEMRDGWETDPFTPVERDGKIYARGAIDSKGHVIAHLKAMESLLASGTCPVNLKLLFEGEEESGSEHIFAFIQANKALLDSDAILVSDGSIPAPDQPTLVYGLRGIVTMELEVRGPARDLHSGHYGGNVHNPIQALVEILAQLHDANGTVTVPGFYDGVYPLTDEEREVLTPIYPYMQTEWRTVTGAPAEWGEAEYRLYERVGVRPTLEINGIEGGFYGEGVKTVLPSRATAKISCRLVPDQDPAHIYRVIRAYLEQIAPPTITYTLRDLDMGARGILLDRDSLPMRTAFEAYKRGWGVEPIFTREGGSIPVVEAFQRELDAPIALMPFGYKGGGAHGPNEHVYLDMFYKGIDTAIHFYQLMAE